MVRNGQVISAVNDPNDYLGPGTGYRVSEARRERDQRIRDVLDREEVLRAEAVHENAEARRIRYRDMGPAAVGRRRRRGRDRHQPGLRPEAVPDHRPAIRCPTVLRELIGGIAEAGREAPRRALPAHGRHLLPRPFRRAARRLRHRHRHPGQGHCGHPPARPAAAQQSRTLLQRADHQARALSALGANAAAYALGEMPEPVVVPPRGEAMGSRYHARVALIYAIETD